MMDTAWTVIWQYVTGILVAVSRDTAIPLSFAFGPSETTDLSSQFYDVFQKEYDLEVSRFVDFLRLSL
jgi:hypothetical protein